MYMVPRRRPPLSLCPRNCYKCGWRRCILREHHDKTDGLYSKSENEDLGVVCKCAVAAKGCDCTAYPPKKDDTIVEDNSAVEGEGDVDAVDAEEAADREATQLENKLYVLMTAKPKAYPSSSSDGRQNAVDAEMIDTLCDDEVSGVFPAGRAQWRASPSPFSEVEEDCSKKSRFSSEVDKNCSKKPRLSEDLLSKKVADSYWV